MYSHLRPQIRVYEANPKPVGLAFGGTVGNERIFLDEDFSKVVVRHHAVDKTYQHGSLIPNQVKFRLTAPHWRYQLDCLLYIVYTAPRYFLSPYLSFQKTGAGASLLLLGCKILLARES